MALDQARTKSRRSSGATNGGSTTAKTGRASAALSGSGRRVFRGVQHRRGGEAQWSSPRPASTCTRRRLRAVRCAIFATQRVRLQKRGPGGTKGYRRGVGSIGWVEPRSQLFTLEPRRWRQSPRPTSTRRPRRLAVVRARYGPPGVVPTGRRARKAGLPARIRARSGDAACANPRARARRSRRSSARGAGSVRQRRRDAVTWCAGAVASRRRRAPPGARPIAG